MKKMMNLKKGIAVLLTAVIAVSGFAISNVYAAKAIETSTKCTVSVNVADLNDEDNADPDRAYNTAQLSSAKFSVNLYKVANVSESAVYTLTDKFKGVTDVDGKEITELSSVTAEEWINIVEKASSIVNPITVHGSDPVQKPAPDYTLEVVGGKGSIDSVAVGLYLVVVPDVETATETYTFNNYLIQLPYVEGSWKLNDDGEYAFVGEDEWIYNVVLNWASKYERTERLTGIKIEKTVDKFNTSMNQTSFVYSIVAEKNYSVDPENPKMVKVFDDVIAIDFSKAETKSIVVDKIPAGSVVTVKEVYTGATYEIAEDTSDVVKLDALTAVRDTNDYPVASFKNTYNDKLVGNGTAVVNTFTKGETGWEWRNSAEVTEQPEAGNEDQANGGGEEPSNEENPDQTNAGNLQ